MSPFGMLGRMFCWLHACDARARLPDRHASFRIGFMEVVVLWFSMDARPRSWQAGNRGFIPLESDFERKRCVKLISAGQLTEIWYWENYLRGIITLKGHDIRNLENIFVQFYEQMTLLQPEKPEPMLNILACFERGEWIVHLIPRKVHRPDRFFAGGEDQILLSPASVDIGGVLITPRESDFTRLSETDIADIFSQVCYSDNEILQIVKNIV